VSYSAIQIESIRGSILCQGALRAPLYILQPVPPYPPLVKNLFPPCRPRITHGLAREFPPFIPPNLGRKNFFVYLTPSVPLSNQIDGNTPIDTQVGEGEIL